jgi:hypothetical protein
VRIVLVGLGAVGIRSARQLLSSYYVTELVVFVQSPARAEAQAAMLGGSGVVQLEELSVPAFWHAVEDASVVVLAVPGPGHYLARTSVEAGVPVVSVSDDPAEVRSLLELDAAAKKHDVAVALGAAMAPGLSCLLAAWAAGTMDEVSEVHVASLGTGGPACAKRRHVALHEAVEEWRDGAWSRKVASSGRDLVWFPDRSGADCYRVNRPDALLLVQAFPALRSVTARAAASRRDRLTSRFPMLRPPHPEGTVGAVRVEVRGWRAQEAESVVVGASGRPALLSGAVAAAAAVRAAAGQLRPGAGGLASLAPSPAALLAELSERGVRIMRFEGAEPISER